MTVVPADLERRPDPAVDSLDPRSTRTVGWFSATALLPMIAAHVLGASAVDPLLDPISWYAFVPVGGELILAGGVVLAVLGLILTVRMYRAGLAVGPVPACAMIVFAAAMVLVGAFPTDPPDAATVTLSALVHRVSAAAAFCVLPIVGLSLERSIRQPRSVLPQVLLRAARALAVAVGLFLVIHLSLVAMGSGIVAFGLIERVGFVIMIGYLYLLAATIDREGPDADDAWTVVALDPVDEAEQALDLNARRSAGLVG